MNFIKIKRINFNFLAYVPIHVKSSPIVFITRMPFKQLIATHNSKEYKMPKREIQAQHYNPKPTLNNKKGLSMDKPFYYLN